MSINLKNNKIFTLLILSIIIILFSFFVIDYAFNIEKKTKDISNIISQIYATEAISSQIEDIEKQRERYINEFDEENSEVSSMFLKEGSANVEYAKFVNDLDKMAKEYNLEFDIQFEGDQSADETKKKKIENKYLKIGLDLRGRFIDVYKFIYKIESYPYLIDIVEFKITKEKESGVFSNVLLKVYAKD